MELYTGAKPRAKVRVGLVLRTAQIQGQWKRFTVAQSWAGPVPPRVPTAREPRDAHAIHECNGTVERIISASARDLRVVLPLQRCRRPLLLAGMLRPQLVE